MKLTWNIAYTWIVLFILQYWLLPAITTEQLSHAAHGLGKSYLAAILATAVTLWQVVLHDMQYATASTAWYISLAAALGLLIYLYKRQLGIHDHAYLQQIQEWRSNELLTTSRILHKSENYHVLKFAKHLQTAARDDIHAIQQILLQPNAAH